MQYEADDTRKCAEVDLCRQCNRKTTSDKSSTCWGVSETGGYGPTDAGAGPGTIYSNGVPRASVASYGFVAGEASMKAEILTRGPIVCLVDGAELKAYSGGVLSKTKASDYTHAPLTVEDGTARWVERDEWLAPEQLDNYTVEGYQFAIQTTSEVVLRLFERRAREP